MDEKNEQLKWILKRLENKNIHTILDAGCGNGWSTSILDSNGFFVVGIDNNEEAIKEARKNFPSVLFPLRDAKNIINDFDAVVCLNVLNANNPDEELLEAFSKEADFGYLSFKRIVSKKDIKTLLQYYGEVTNMKYIRDFLLVEIKFYERENEKS